MPNVYYTNDIQQQLSNLQLQHQISQQTAIPQQQTILQQHQAVNPQQTAIPQQQVMLQQQQTVIPQQTAIPQHVVQAVHQPQSQGEFMSLCHTIQYQEEV